MSKPTPFFPSEKNRDRSSLGRSLSVFFKIFAFCFFISAILFQSSCLVVESPFPKLPPGVWRATLDLTGKTNAPKGDEDDVQSRAFEEVSAGELPFTMEVDYEQGDSSMSVTIINGEERMKVENILFGRTKYRALDTFRIDFPVYDTYLKGTFRERFMKGKWVVNYKENYEIPFVAEYGRDFRFTTLKKEPKIDLTGRWEVSFSLDYDPYPAVGIFEQKGNHLTGTFLTETGDYRFLEGTVQENKLYLSCFDGAHAFLFEGKILEDERIIGSFRSGKHYQTTWSAKRNPEAELKDPDQLTFLKEGFDEFNFSFKNPKGETVTLSDEKYEDKVKLVQIFGTWCPNCRDETKFLVDYLKNNSNERLEVVGIGFERYIDEQKSMNLLKNYKEKMDIPYELVLGGTSSSKKKAAEALPMLNHVLSYPTMIFIDKNNKVRKIHTGFSGPATDTYEKYKQEFESFVAKLLNE